MSFSFGFGWAKSDPNDLCMKVETLPSENSYVGSSATPSISSFVFQFQLQQSCFPKHNLAARYRVSDDFEQISAFTICRLLTKCSDVLLYPDGSMPVIQLLSGDQQSFSILKSKIGLSLALDGDTEDREFECSTAEEHYYHTVMFQTYNCLLNQGWGAFATDTQLRGVVAKPISETEFHVASLTNCTINYKGEGILYVDVHRYKISPLHLEPPQSHNCEAVLPSWSLFERPMQCVFLPTGEEVQLTAVLPYVPHIPTHATSRTATCSPAQHREYEKCLFLTPLDVANRARGFSAFVPDSYSRARLYWELAYGVLLPKNPSPVDQIVFARIQTALGEQTVPVSALTRGVAEVPWKGEGAAREAASSVYSAIKDLTCFQHLAPPMRPQELSFQLQQAYGSSGGAGVSVPEVRNADTNANTGVGFGAAPVRVSPLVSALCMRNAVQAAAGASTTTTSTVSAPSPPLQVSVHVTPAKALHPCYEDEEEESPLLSLFGDETDVPTPPVPKKTTLAPAAPAPLAPAPVAKRMKGGQSSKAAPAVLPTAKQRSATAVVPEEQRAAPVTTKKSIVRSSAPAQAHAAVVAAVAIAQQHQLRPGIGSNADDSDDLDLGSSSSGSSSSDFDSDVELDHKTAAPIQTTPLRTSMVAAKKVTGAKRKQPAKSALNKVQQYP